MKALTYLQTCLIAGSLLAGCSEEGVDLDAGGDGGSRDGATGDAGTEVECPGTLPTAAQTCTSMDCTSMTGLKTFGEAGLASRTATAWIVVASATSEIAAENETTSLIYGRINAGGLTRAESKPAEDWVAKTERVRARVRAQLGDDAFSEIYEGANAARIRAERAVKSEPLTPFQYDPRQFRGTAIRGRSLVPNGVRAQAMACTSANPALCGDAALCVIPEGMTSGTCQNQLTLKFPMGGNNFVNTPATVRAVGSFGAIVVDDAITAMVSENNVDELMRRFDTHIAPLDHALFGQPENLQGQDRDGNGVVIIFLTGKVADRGIPNLAGFFVRNDLLPTSMNVASNAADILYMREPNANNTLDQLSGTIAHEYQHLINVYAKTVRRQSQEEDLWLDEGLATFAEEVTGYGQDAYGNLVGLLPSIDVISMTGDGTCPDGAVGDSICRRAFAHLLVRYLFEQKGGASFGAGGAGEFTDAGGVAAVNALVQSDSTGTSLFSTQTNGLSFPEWLHDLLTTIALDGQGYANASCNPRFKFDPPTRVAFTNYTRGVDMRGSFINAMGRTVTLAGPTVNDFVAESVPVPANAGEIRRVVVPSGTAQISLGGAVEYDIRFRAIPALR